MASCCCVRTFLNKRHEGGGFAALSIGRCPKVFGFGSPNIDCRVADDKDFSLALEMTIRESR